MEVAAKTAIPADDKKRRVKSYISGTLEVLEGEVLATFEKTKVVAVVGSAEARDDSAAASMDRRASPRRRRAVYLSAPRNPPSRPPRRRLTAAA